MSTSLSAQASATDTGQAALPDIADPLAIAPKDARAISKLFFDRLRTLEEGTAEYQYARNTLIEMNLSLVHFVAARYRNHGNGELEDIVQVGTVGLIKAIDRFELSREVEFTSFAIPYISGEIKRFFRDTTWSVHVPRRLQELRVTLARAKEELATTSAQEVTVADLADHIQISEGDVIEGLIAANGYTADSLDVPADTAESSSGAGIRTYADLTGDCDPRIELVENLRSLAPLIDALDDRERAIVQMRFGQELTQAQIGDRLGLSQMHVSRLLSRILRRLREGILAED
ncbi:SigB/SigF/SigG family RNA polymerase sigma factor [Streptomyces sp. NPDC058637]|uniref:SigB/SigF/SigG family RNA polymerase sigma factor n=1 Tax=Streptomyces sp. NPDC058637 TaxID=3346569 RepID=UPI00366A54C4